MFRFILRCIVGAIIGLALGAFLFCRPGLDAMIHQFTNQDARLH